MDPHFGLPLQFPSAFSAVHGPIPVDQHTHEGRYLWDPRLHPLHHGSPGMPSGGTTPNLPDFALLAQRRAAMANGHLEAAHTVHPPYRISPYMEQLYGAFPSTHTPSITGLGPVDGRGLPLHSEYLQQMAALGQRCMLGDCHSSARQSSGAMSGCDYLFPADGSHLASPHPGTRHGRKRALSSSPYLSDMDIGSMIRFSPNSLISFMNGSRSSSTSGSYGHLSAGTLSPAMGISQQTAPSHLHHLMRQNCPMGFVPSSLAHQPLFGAFSSTLGATKLDSGIDVPCRPETASNVVSSTVEEEGAKISRVNLKKEELLIDDDKDTVADMKDEPGDFIETSCHWVDCGKEFATQDELVKHINDDHTHGNKKLFVCRWKECSREEKPFKAHYMLVVHMRRHTGEKPHKCTFEGCSKAYSRLENLKTHLRSHTGERPYMCEFPGCTKAFSNASDRAKHQNRTHSNAKPYVCKAPGCTKRYTDPSSLRKHVRTVHGDDFYANKKHKGTDGKDGDKDVDDQNLDPGSTGGSPNSEGSGATHTASLSSPSVKSEDSPHGIREDTTDGMEAPISDNSISTTSGTVEADNVWEVADNVDVEPLEELAVGPCGVTSSVNKTGDRSARNRLKNKIQAQLKTARSWLPNLLPSRRGGGRNPSNQSQAPEPVVKLSGIQCDKQNGSTKITDLKAMQPPTTVPHTGDNQPTVRRNSGSSTVSSFYSSMQSEASSQPLSSYSSKSSQGPAHSLKALSSPYDPISLGSSRRSSEASSSLSVGLNHLHKLHAKALTSQHLTNTANLVVQSQNESLASDCENFGSHHTTSLSVQPNNFHASNNQSQATVRMNTPCNSNFSKIPSVANGKGHHPNQNVVLEALEEDKPVEENQDLILPDEVVSYLHERAEQGQRPNSAMSQAVTSVSQYIPPEVPEANCPSKNAPCLNNTQPYAQYSEEKPFITNGLSCNHCHKHHTSQTCVPQMHCAGQPYCAPNMNTSSQSCMNHLQPQHCVNNQNFPQGHSSNTYSSISPNFDQSTGQMQCNPNMIPHDQRCEQGVPVQNSVYPNMPYFSGTPNHCHQMHPHAVCGTNFVQNNSQTSNVNNNYSCPSYEQTHPMHNSFPSNNHNVNHQPLFNHHSTNAAANMNQNVNMQRQPFTTVRPISPNCMKYSSPNGQHNCSSVTHAPVAQPCASNSVQGQNPYGGFQQIAQNNLSTQATKHHQNAPLPVTHNISIPPQMNSNYYQGNNYPVQSNVCHNTNSQCYNQSGYSQSNLEHQTSIPVCNQKTFPSHQNSVMQYSQNQNLPIQSNCNNFNQAISVNTGNSNSVINNCNKQESASGGLYYNACSNTPLHHGNSNVNSFETVQNNIQNSVEHTAFSNHDSQDVNHRLCPTHSIQQCQSNHQCPQSKQNHSTNASLQAQHSASSVSEFDTKGSSVSAAAHSCHSCSNDPREIQCQSVSQSSLSSMHPDAYQRTLEYVQQCQQLLGKQQPSPGCNRVSSSTDRHSPAVSESPLLATSNMVINDLNSGLYTLVEETKFLHLLQ